MAIAHMNQKAVPTSSGYCSGLPVPVKPNSYHATCSSYCYTNHTLLTRAVLILEVGQGGGAVALPRFEEKYKLSLKGVE